MKNIEEYSIQKIVVKERVKFLLFAMATILLLLFSYHGSLKYAYTEQKGKFIFYCLLGFISLFTAIYVLASWQAISFLSKLKKHRKGKKIQKNIEKIIFWNKADILLTDTSIYLMHRTFLGKMVSFSYQQLDRIESVSKTYLIGLEVVTENALQFTLIDGTTYRIGDTEKKREEISQIKTILLEKNPNLQIKL